MSSVVLVKLELAKLSNAHLWKETSSMRLPHLRRIKFHKVKPSVEKHLDPSTTFGNSSEAVPRKFRTPHGI